MHAVGLPGRPCRLLAQSLAFSLAAALALPGAASAANTPREELSRWCAQITPRLPRISRAQCLDSALLPTGALSQKRVPIMGRRFAADHRAGKPLRILLLGGIHGDELTSSAVVFEWMRLQAASRRQDYNWFIVPVLNPDGMLAKQPTRVNANGVDLNRNFPTPDWDLKANTWWVRHTKRDPRRYPGRAPLSEPESRWLHQEIERSRPDLVVSVHAPFGLLDFDGPAPAPQRFGSLRMERVGVYPGSLGNYGGYYKNVPVVTIELPNARQMPSPEETRRIWDDMQRWIAQKLPAKTLPAEALAPERRPSLEAARRAL